MKRIKQEIIKNIVDDLINTTLLIKEIAIKYDVSEDVVSLINRCKTHKNLHSYQKNIRKEILCLNQEVINTYIERDGYCELHIQNLKGEKAIVLIDLDDLEKCKIYKWTCRKDEQGNYRIKSCSAKLHNLPLHHFIMGKPSKDKVIDHINRNPCDNRKDNLREVSFSINSTNARARIESSTKIRGVYKRKERIGISKEAWICEWSEDGKRHSASFSIDKYGEEKAFELAFNLRKEKLKELKI